MPTDLATIAARQLGLLTRVQALDHGCSAAMIRSRVRRGIWLPAAAGVYRVAGAPVTWTTGVLAACLATGGVASHRTAAVLHRVDGFRPGRVEITVGRGSPGSRVGTGGVTVHRSRDLDLAGTVRVDGVPTTDPARLAVDLGAVIPADRFDRAVDDLVGRRLLSWEDALAALLAHARRGRNGVGALRALLEARSGADVPESALERAFLRVLANHRVPEPVLQHEIVDGAGFVARVDAAYPEARVAVELDGLRWHLPADRFEDDHRKRARLAAAGWTVLAFTWPMLMGHPGGVVDAVRSVLGRNGAPAERSHDPERAGQGVTTRRPSRPPLRSAS
jgi:hypothetical protein